MQHEGFREGDFTTHFVDEQFDPEALSVNDPEGDALAALAATLYYAETQEEDTPRITTVNETSGTTPWRRRRRYASG
jgi:propionyl-CoA carboxylase alpha chain